MAKFLSRTEALTLLQQAQEVHEGKRSLPPEIIRKKEEIRKAMHHAELFVYLFGVVDHGMVYRVVALKLELDGLYGAWAESETPSETVH